MTPIGAGNGKGYDVSNIAHVVRDGAETSQTHGDRVHTEQAQHATARAVRRAAIPYNANAPTDTAGTVAQAKGTTRRRRVSGDAA